MDGKYLAIFARSNGRAISDVGDIYLDLQDGYPLNEVAWEGESWTRISDLRGGVVHYLPSSALA